jgi:hypothetical protein
MRASRLRHQNGWVSLPIIALLLALSTLSVNYQQRLQAAFKWRGQLNEAEAQQEIWGDFYRILVSSPSFVSATVTECLGFCDLRSHLQEKTWQNDDQQVNYRWERYQPVSGEATNPDTFYRLCATQNQQQYRCWWWREHRLISNGWVTASD